MNTWMDWSMCLRIGFLGMEKSGSNWKSAAQCRYKYSISFVSTTSTTFSVVEPVSTGRGLFRGQCVGQQGLPTETCNASYSTHTIPYIPYITQHIPHNTHHIAHTTQHTLYTTLQTTSTHTPHHTHHTTPHTSHPTHHTQHITLHTSHHTHHTTPHMLHQVKKDILASFIKHQLAEYAVLFADEQEVASSCLFMSSIFLCFFVFFIFFLYFLFFSCS